MKDKAMPTSYPPRSNPAIHPGSVGGIAVDTNIYRATGFRFRSFPLVRLTDIKPWQIVLLVPEVWERELERHTTAWAEVAGAMPLLREGEAAVVPPPLRNGYVVVVSDMPTPR